MNSSKIKAIKGLSIANIVLSALCVLVLVIAAIVCVMLTSYYDPIFELVGDYVPDGSYGNHGYSYGYSIPGYDYSYDFNGKDISSIYDDLVDSQVLMVVLQIGIFFIVAAAIMQSVALAAAIIIFLNCDKPEKSGFVFGWGIAGAVLSFLSSGFVQVALFILSTVFVYRERNVLADGGRPTAYSAPQHQSVPQPGHASDISTEPQAAPQGNQSAQAATALQPQQSIQRDTLRDSDAAFQDDVEQIDVTEVEIHPEGNVSQPGATEGDRS